jgi:branched-chain amino acid transport system substrate-binding protein
MKRTLRTVPWLMGLCFLFLLLLNAQPVLAKDEILLGSHLPLSGIGSLVGREQKWAYDRAIEDINRAGGIYVKEYGKRLRVHLIAVDDESSPEIAAAAVERLINRTKVDMILSGQVGAMGTLPGMIAAEKYKTYYHGTVIWIPTFLEQNFKWCTMYFFDMNQGASMTFGVWNSLPEKTRPKRLGLFLEDSFDGKMMGDVWAQLGKKFGYKFVMRETIGMGAKDFSKQIFKGKEADVDAIFCMANVPETVTLIRQMKENKFSVKYFQGLKGTWATEFQKALGRDADYVLCDGFWSEDYPFKGAKELGKRFYEEFGKNSVGIGMYYAVCQILFQAVEKAGTLNGAKVRQAVLDNEFETVNGKVKYDEKGVALFPLADFQWWKGRQRVIYPFHLAKYKIKPAPPWEKR